MIRLVKAAIRRLMMRTEKGRRMLLSYRLQFFLDENGYFRSVLEGRAVDREGRPLPWLTYGAIAFLRKRVRPDMSVFEYGSGSSTLWWAERVARVVSYEHDLDWYNRLKDQLPANVAYVHCPLEPGGEYAKAISTYDHAFDVVLIDGRDRVNCARNSLGALKDGGVIVWDNTEREKYEEGYAYLLRNGFRRLDFEGLFPAAEFAGITSIFYRDGNCFGI
jgi:hypothetical protein